LIELSGVMKSILLCSPGTKIVVWDLESKMEVDTLSSGVEKNAPTCLSLAWSADGATLFAGYSDNLIRVFQVTRG
jgi:guanine nucleotide-binding protein subunit beta-2-like 1 protein